MKKFFYAIASVAAISLLLIGCNPETPPVGPGTGGGEEDPVLVTSVALTPSTLTLVTGDTAEPLTLTVLPEDADDKSVKWESDNTAVATVANGVVTAVAPGEATITATANDESGKSGSCVVTVEAAEVPVTSVELNKATLTLVEEASETLIATVLPDKATDRTVTWDSNNKAVATVDTDGKVVAVSAGTATITATANDGSGLSDECEVTVEAKLTTPPHAKTTNVWFMGDYIWSDAIDFCNKDEELLDEYNGGEYNAPLADCRANPDPQYGHLYSWLYVQNNATDLCPDGWRVPTQEDFIALDIELGGTGLDNQSNAPQAPKYINDWGGQYGGYVAALSGGFAHYEDGQGTMAYYWSSTELSAGAGGSMNFLENGFVDPQKRSGKEQGFQVRCVKDAE